LGQSIAGEIDKHQIDLIQPHLCSRFSVLFTNANGRQMGSQNMQIVPIYQDKLSWEIEEFVWFAVIGLDDFPCFDIVFWFMKSRSDRFSYVIII
jgi:hypothetical protein